MDRQFRDRGLRRHLVRGGGEGDGRGKGPRLFPETGGDEAADPQRPHAHDRARRRRRDPGGADALQPGGGQAEGTGRADRLEAAPARIRPGRRHRRGEAGAAPARGAALRGFRAVARRAALHHGRKPRAGESQGRKLVRPAQFPHRRAGAGRRRVGHLGATLADALPEGAEIGVAPDAHKLRFGGDCEGFLYLPRSESPAGAVVILHERYGLVQHTLDLARRLARDGYVALAPNLFSRWKGDEAALRSGKERAVLPDPEVAAMIDAALDFLKGHPRVAPERIALMGVCQSGRYPIVVGSRRRDLAALVVFYGGSQQRDWQVSELQPQPMQEMMRSLSAPALFVFGERDHTISLADVRRARDTLEEGRCSYRMKVFRDMPHGWLNDTMPGRYRAKEADEAWIMLLRFLADVFSGAWPGKGQVRWEFEGASSADYDFSKNVRLECVRPSGWN